MVLGEFLGVWAWGLFFLWVRGMGEGRTDSLPAGAAAGAEFFVVCWEMVWHRRCAGCGWGEFFGGGVVRGLGIEAVLDRV